MMTSQTKSKEVAVQGKTKALETVNPAVQGNWSFSGDASDILVPRLLLAQPASQSVADEKVQAGAIYNSISGKAVGGRGENFRVIPIYHTKTWNIFHTVNGKQSFLRSEAFTAENRNADWEWSENGVLMKREANLNFFVLSPDEIEKDLKARQEFQSKGVLPDTEDSLIPYFISFKSTSYHAGKYLVTHFAKAADFNMPPFVMTFNLTSEKQSNDRGNYFVYKVEKAEKTPEAMLAVCKKWREIVQGSGAVEVHEAESKKTDPVQPSQEIPF